MTHGQFDVLPVVLVVGQLCTLPIARLLTFEASQQFLVFFVDPLELFSP